MKKLLLILPVLSAALLMSSCTTVEPRTEPISVYLEGYSELNIPLYKQGYSYRSDGASGKYHSESHYYHKSLYKSPVWAGIVRSNGRFYLEMENRGGTYMQVQFRHAEVDQYIAAIETYLDWVAQAEARGDYFIKDIYSDKTVRIRFFTHEGYTHYLALTPVSIGIPNNGATQFFGPEYAKVILSMLRDYRDGSINRQTINSLYATPAPLGEQKNDAYVY